MGRFLYNLFLPVYLLVFLPGLLVKMRRRGGYGAHFWQRFGCYDRETRAMLGEGERSWWLHAVSVGEVLIALKLIERIQQRLPEQRLILSTTSSTGYATARDKAPDGVQVIYNPVDLPGVVQRVLGRLRPRLVVLMESELWPNLIAAASKRGIPVLIANARLSPRSGKRYARFRALASPTLNRLTAVLTQEAGDGERWAATGLASDKIHCLGSIKFDPAAHQAPGEDQLGELRLILKGLWGDLGENYAVLLGSSHAGEEMAVTKIYAKLRVDFPQVRRRSWLS
jgi:3-deoxy-D-manno-octulosonic-acid transferase